MEEKLNIIMPMPIIMPIHSVYGGGSLPVSSLGWFLLAILAYGSYAVFCFWIIEKFFDGNFALILATTIGLPLLIGGLMLINL